MNQKRLLKSQQKFKIKDQVVRKKMLDIQNQICKKKKRRSVPLRKSKS